MTSVNVQVAVRCRPLNQKEKDANEKPVIDMEEGVRTLVKNLDDPSSKPKTYTFDHSYDMTATQEMVYNDLALPLLTKAFDGYNGTIFAYGQTSSGKTHTMMGYDGDLGIIPRMNMDIFKRIKELTTDERKFLIEVSYLEIYNEQINDLLCLSDEKLTIRENPKLGVYVEGLSHFIVNSAEQLNQYIEQGNQVRRVASTNMNNRSSRSHSCFVIKVDQKQTVIEGNTQKETSLEAKINLVDLAGSERAAKTGATGDTLKEGAAINKSLSALGNVINALTDPKKNKHIPYRDSKLTRLLQTSLGGNALTIMIAAISPAKVNYDETISTLNFANRAKMIKNETRRNEDKNETVIRELRDQIKALREQLSKQGQPMVAGEEMTEAEKQKMKEMEALIADLEQAKSKSWEEKERLHQMYEEERKQNMKNENTILAVMNNIKEETEESMKKLKKLKKARSKLRERYKIQKMRFKEIKADFDKIFKIYQTLEQTLQDGTCKEEEKPIIQQKLEETGNFIKKQRQVVLDEKSDLEETKNQLEVIEKEYSKEKDQLEVKKTVVSSDTALREAIQKEEREKMRLERDAYLEKSLELEKQRLKEDYEKSVRREKLKYEREINEYKSRIDDLEIELAEERLQKQKLIYEKSQAEKQFNEKIKEIKLEHDKALEVERDKSASVVKEMFKVYEDQLKGSHSSADESRRLLAEAIEDIRVLTKENIRLRCKLEQAIMWEPE